MNITIGIDNRTQFGADVIVTIVESGYTSSWARISGYRWADEDGEHDAPNTTAKLTEVGDDETDGESVTLTPDVIAQAVKAIAEGDSKKLRLHKDYCRRIVAAFVTDDAGEIDAELADYIAQVATMGEVRYG